MPIFTVLFNFTNMTNKQNKQKLCINEWAETDRPREKMLEKGIDALTNAELLAILIGSGNTEETAVELTQRILASCGNSLSTLGKRSVDELCSFKGIGNAKAITIMAASELGKRRKSEEVTERKTISCSQNVYDLFHPILCDLPTEEFWILLLNQAGKIIDKVKISSGGINETTVDVRTILREALLQRATQIILCHNHPSGNNHPSIYDDRLTNQIQQGARTMNICVSDHVIVCDGTFYSYADECKL